MSAARAREWAHEMLENPALCCEDGTDHPHQHPACDRLVAARLDMEREHAAEVERLRGALRDAISATTGGPALTEGRWSEIRALSTQTEKGEAR